MKYGARGAYWASMISDADATAAPVYNEAVSVPGVNKVEDSIELNSASAYGDDRRAVEISEFKAGTVNVTHLDIAEDTLAAACDLKTSVDGGLTYNAEADPPFGAYGFYAACMTDNKERYFKVVFYPKVRANVSAESFDTKGENITLANDQLPFAMYQTARGDYKVTKRFDTAPEAIAYLAGLFSGASAFPGYLDAAQGSNDAAQGNG